jgi:hypothetical protein
LNLKSESPFSTFFSWATASQSLEEEVDVYREEAATSETLQQQNHLNEGKKQKASEAVENCDQNQNPTATANNWRYHRHFGTGQVRLLGVQSEPCSLTNLSIHQSQNQHCQQTDTTTTDSSRKVVVQQQQQQQQYGRHALPPTTAYDQQQETSPPPSDQTATTKQLQKSASSSSSSGTIGGHFVWRTQTCRQHGHFRRHQIMTTNSSNLLYKQVIHISHLGTRYV